MLRSRLLTRRLRVRLLVLSMFAATLLLLPASGPLHAATTGLVAAYNFDAGAGTSVADASGNGLNGTLVNATWVAGKYGSALRFNGTSSRVTIPDAASLHLSSAMTLEAWVNPTTATKTWRDVVYKANDNYYLSASGSGNGYPAGGGIFGGSYAEAFANKALAVSTWAHLAVTYDGAAVRFYVNGALVSTKVKTGSIATSTNPLTLGSDAIYGQYFNGLIDDVRVYNVALTAAQIQTDMATPVAPAAADTTPPSAPTALTPTAVGTTSIGLSWSAAVDNVGVTGYRVFLNGAQVGTPLSTSYLFGGLTCGTTYTLGVAAVDAASNVSTTSSIVQQTAACPDTTPPGAPGTLTATAVASAEIDLAWGAASDNVAVTAYRVERCQGAGCSNFAEIATTAATSYKDGSVSPSTSYSYRVRAADAAGNLGSYGNGASAVTPGVPDTTPPSAPGTLGATAGNGQIDLSWGAATDNVGVTGYRIERCQGGGCAIFAEVAAVGVVTSYSDSAAAPGVTYRYRVRATDAAGNLGGYSNVATASLPAPPAPVPVAAYSFDEAAGNSVGDASGHGNTGAVSGAGWVAGKTGGALSFDGSSSRVTVPDSATLHLSSGMTLEAWVDAGSNSGWRDLIYKGDDNYYLSASSAPTDRPAGGGTIGAAPGEAFATAALAMGTWTHLAVTYDGANIRLYVNGVQDAVAAQTGAIASSTNPLTIGSDPLYGQYFNGLIDDVRVYDVALTPTQIQNDMATPVSPPPPDTTPPSTPSGLTATSVGQSSIGLSWNGSVDNVAVAGYQMYLNGTQVASSLVTSYLYGGLTCGTSYTLGVAAFDSATNVSGVASLVVSTAPCPDTTPPSAPGALSSTAASSSEIDLSWGAATDNVSVTGYRVERCQGASCSNFAEIASIATTTYRDQSVSPATTYSYRVRATDAAGNLGAYGNSTSATTPGLPDTTPPSAPSNLTATAASARIDLAWIVATDNVAVTGYRVERCQGAGCSNFAQITSLPATATAFSDTTAAAGTTYSYRVRATDAAGNLGAYSNVATASIPASTGPTPVAAYSFDEGAGTTAGDTSGNNNLGTITAPNWVNGKYGKALSFDGSSSGVTVQDAAALHLSTAMTLEAWVNPGANSGWRDVIYKGNDNYYLSGSSTTDNLPAGGGLIGGSYGEAYATSPMPTGTWTHLALTYDGANVRLFVNGVQAAITPKTGTLASSTYPLTIGSDPIYGQFFNGSIDDVRVYNVALSAAQIQSDMATPVTPPATDTSPPVVAVTSPVDGATVTDATTVNATASDASGISVVQFFVDGVAAGVPDTTAPYSFTWESHFVSNGTHTLAARATDGHGITAMSPPVSVTVTNGGVFQDEVLATGFSLPTSFAFLPDGRIIVGEMGGAVKIIPPPYTQPDSTPLLQLTNVAPALTTGNIQGLMNVAVDPAFATNHYFYVYYTTNSPYRSRLSRFTANATVTGTVAGSEFVLYQDPVTAGADHHGGAILFGNDGKLYFTTGDEVSTPGDAQLLTSPRGKIHRINMDGTIPTDNPFYDGTGPNVDSIWARGLRNPFHAFYDAPTGRIYVGDVGGNNYATATEEIDLGIAGANYAWPNCESSCASPPYTNGIYSYPHNGRDAAVVSGFVYHGSQFPSAYEGSYFLADYAQNWIKRLTFDASGQVNGVFSFEPPDGSPDGPYGSIVELEEGPDGALYYLDIGFDDNTDSVTTPKLRRIRYVSIANLPPTAVAGADATTGPPPLTVHFSSAGSTDPEGQPLSYQWSFGDGGTSTSANPAHVYSQAGRYVVRVTVSDGTSSTISAPITITVGTPPTVTITAPTDGATFRGGDVIAYSGTASDAEDGPLPASAYSWTIDFLHEGHVHPGAAVAGSTSGTFTIPVTGHDFSGNTRYRISLTVTDSTGLSTTTSVIIWPQKVNLTFNTVPTGLTLYLDGIAHTAPFVYDTLIGFNHTVEARDQALGSSSYTFGSWSDGGSRQHVIVVPSADTTYSATFNTTSAPIPPAFVQSAYSTPQSPQTSVTTSFPAAQTSGNLNLVVIGWDNATANLVSVTDSAGNVYQQAAPTTRSSADSQAVFYAKNIAGAATNTVTVTMNGQTPYIDVRVAEYSGLDRTNPLGVVSSASGSSTQPNSGSATTTTPTMLLVGAGTTTGSFNAPGSGYTKRVITVPDSDILEDRVVTSTGTYSATGTLNATAAWVMQIVAFRAAGQG